MSIRRQITNKAFGTLSVFLAVVLMGCQGQAKTNEQTGQTNEMEEAAVLTSEQESELPEFESQVSELTDLVKNVLENIVDESDNGLEQSEQSIADMESGSGIETDESQPDKPQPPEGWELVFASEDWGLSFGESGTQPVGNASAQDLAWYDAYYVGDDSEKVIYLTFDCGYENGNTEPILDALKKHDVQATFFVVGHFLETAPDMAKRMVEEGHTVGNHTYHHLDMPTISDQETFQREMDDVANLFREITGTELSRYYRPPQGKCNTQNLKMAQELGYSTIFWSLAYVDWNQDDQPSHKEAFEKLTTRIHPGAIVLLHNTSQTNGEILDELLTKWEEMGYTFRPLAELINQ